MLRLAASNLKNISRAQFVSRAPASTRSIVTLKDHKYTAHATATGAGRNGEAKSGDMTLKLAMPKELGGTGAGANPEQLFAMGYSACFLGALQAVAASAGKKDAVKNAVVNISVHIGEPNDLPGFGLAVEIDVAGVSDKDLVKTAHEFCPYSRALKHGVDIKVSP